MKAVLCKAFCEPGDLTVEDVPALAAEPGKVVIEVAGIGVNFHDGLMVQGRYQTKPPFPFSPGSEISGVVKSIGEGVSTLSIGQRVMAFCGVGGYAEEVAVEASRVFAIPDAMDFATAGGFIITYATSYHALKDQAALQPGETLLVLGAAGGVGMAALQLGKAMGARVVAAASSAEKLELCRRLGADATVDYSAGGWRDTLKGITGGAGIDVVYDPVGGAQAEPAIRSLAWGGRYLVIGFAAGDIPRIPLNLLLLKEAAIKGVFWGAWSKRDPAADAVNMAALLALHESGTLRPQITAIRPLDEAPQALQEVHDRKMLGKVVLVAKQTEAARR